MPYPYPYPPPFGAPYSPFPAPSAAYGWPPPYPMEASPGRPSFEEENPARSGANSAPRSPVMDYREDYRLSRPDFPTIARRPSIPDVSSGQMSMSSPMLMSGGSAPMPAPMSAREPEVSV